MKRLLINKFPFDTPDEIRRFSKGAKIYDSSSSPEARVYFLDTGEGYYLKVAERGALEKEAVMDGYFFNKGIGVEPIAYISNERDWLLTARARGEDCTSYEYVSHPERLCDRLAEELRRLHETDFSDCPIKNHTESYLSLAKTNYESGNYDKSHFPDSFGYSSAEEAMAVLRDGASALKNEVLLHGDYCLPNIILDGWRLSAFIDVGSGGVGDRHVDLFWGAWTLWFNLKTDKYRKRFLDAYGRDKIDEELLKVVAAAEVFG